VDAQPDTITLELGKQLDGAADKFGKRMMDAILVNYPNEVLPQSGSVTGLLYSDRYINTPLKVALIANWIAEIKRHFADQNRWNCKQVEIKTSRSVGLEDENPYNTSWNDSRARDAVLRLAIQNCVPLRYDPDVFAEHLRGLTIQFDDGAEFTFRLDSGLSHWEATGDGRPDFSFEESPKLQASNLLKTQSHIGSIKGKPPTAWLRWVKKKL